MLKKILSLTVIISFFLTSLGPLPKAHADTVLGLPAPGTMINLSPAYEPVMIKGLTVHKDNPFLFDFIVDVGQDRMSGEPLKKEGEKLIKYFLASLAIPDKDVWVNLSPYEKNKMIPEALGQTDMGRDLLEQDYILKQITASLIYPEKQLGKTFWDRVYAKARETYGTTQVPVNTFNKVWIMADRAEVFEHGQTVFVVDQHLKVMLEEDYLAITHHSQIKSHTIASQIVKQIILPELEKEVNTGKNFANLRQIFNSIILSSWYKKNLKEALLNQIYADKARVKGIDLSDPAVKQQIYEQYLKAYKKGVFNYIKEDVNTANGEALPRKYFSGGIDEAMAAHPTETVDQAALSSLPWDREMVDFTTFASTQSVYSGGRLSKSERVAIRQLRGADSYAANVISRSGLNKASGRALKTRIQQLQNQSSAQDQAMAGASLEFQLGARTYRGGDVILLSQRILEYRSILGAFKKWANDGYGLSAYDGKKFTWVPDNPWHFFSKGASSMQEAVISQYPMEGITRSLASNFIFYEKISKEELKERINAVIQKLDRDMGSINADIHNAPDAAMAASAARVYDSYGQMFDAEERGSLKDIRFLDVTFGENGSENKARVRVSDIGGIWTDGFRVDQLKGVETERVRISRKNFISAQGPDAAMAAYGKISDMYAVRGSIIGKVFELVIGEGSATAKIRLLVTNISDTKIIGIDAKTSKEVTIYSNELFHAQAVPDAAMLSDDIIHVVDDWFESPDKKITGEEKDQLRRTLDHFSTNMQRLDQWKFAINTAWYEYKRFKNVEELSQFLGQLPGMGEWLRQKAQAIDALNGENDDSQKRIYSIFATIESLFNTWERYGRGFLTVDMIPKKSPLSSSNFGISFVVSGKQIPNDQLSRMLRGEDAAMLIRLNPDEEIPVASNKTVTFKIGSLESYDVNGASGVVQSGNYFIGQATPGSDVTIDGLRITVRNDQVYAKNISRAVINYQGNDAAMSAANGDNGHPVKLFSGAEMTVKLKERVIFNRDPFDYFYVTDMGAVYYSHPIPGVDPFIGQATAEKKVEHDGVIVSIINDLVEVSNRSSIISYQIVDAAMTAMDIAEMFLEDIHEGNFRPERYTGLHVYTGTFLVKDISLRPGDIALDDISIDQGVKPLSIGEEFKTSAKGVYVFTGSGGRVLVFSGRGNETTLTVAQNPWVQGGIDLNTSNGMQWKVSKDGRGVEMNIDPAMIARVRREGIDSLSPVILRMTPVASIWSLIGLQAPVK